MLKGFIVYTKLINDCVFCLLAAVSVGHRKNKQNHYKDSSAAVCILLSVAVKLKDSRSLRRLKKCVIMFVGILMLYFNPKTVRALPLDPTRGRKAGDYFSNTANCVQTTSDNALF